MKGNTITTNFNHNDLKGNANINRDDMKGNHDVIILYQR